SIPGVRRQLRTANRRWSSSGVTPPDPWDPFAAERTHTGVMDGRVGEEAFVMVLRYADLRATARNWQAFTSDAPFRVPIPAEHDMRPVRQLPIETDPPEHTAYRRIVAEPFSGQAAAAN